MVTARACCGPQRDIPSVSEPGVKHGKTTFESRARGPHVAVRRSGDSSGISAEHHKHFVSHRSAAMWSTTLVRWVSVSLRIIPARPVLSWREATVPGYVSHLPAKRSGSKVGQPRESINPVSGTRGPRTWIIVVDGQAKCPQFEAYSTPLKIGLLLPDADPVHIHSVGCGLSRSVAIDRRLPRPAVYFAGQMDLLRRL